ncbi:hypothetical protein [Vibrio sp. 99-70-13A1]|uniref:hypothetical protein n=1 Tax=Vibrio sp. 99-70-13A1 TaxID=2607601 RepID=UPI0014935C67|nr:hypothetical protein [Vibrio sp. 99-70-13A1]NOH99045.1 hypothetical protein [Vibrio sp. 99-70-13A1]
MFAKINTAVQLLLAVAVFYLGYSIHGFTSKVGEVIDTYPQVISDLESLTNDLQVDEWLVVAKTVEEVLPQALESVEQVRMTVDKVNQTVSSVDKKIPLILDEVENIRSVSVPAVLSEVKRVRVEVVPPMLTELKGYRTQVVPPLLLESEGYRHKTVPAMITESQLLRAEIPPILVKADQVIDKSKILAEEVTQGAVKGVVLSPINLLRDAGNELKLKVQE